MRKLVKTVISAALLSGALLLGGCGRNSLGKLEGMPTPPPSIAPSNYVMSTPEPGADSGAAIILTEEPSATAQVSPSPVVSVAPTAVPTSAPVRTPSPTQTAAPSSGSSAWTTPAPAATPAAALPVVTKSPTDEKVIVNGSCYFVAKYQNAIWAVWHFVSPDGMYDLDYTDIAAILPAMEILGGDTSTMQLKNIPQSLNNWRVYCRFSNRSGSVDTSKALLTVTTSTDGAPKVTKSPTDETVQLGGSASFVARHDGAIWAVWHFVSPDGTQDLTYRDAVAQFAGLKIVGGDRPTMQLGGIPADLNGWRVYCAFSNNIGTTNTAAARILISGMPAPSVPTPTPTATLTPDDVYSSIYNGTYIESYAHKAAITISGGPDTFQVVVNWPSSNAVYSTWIFSGAFDGRAVMNYDNCIKTTSTSDLSGNVTTVTDYIGGTGYLRLTEYGLGWSDAIEHIADGLLFDKLQ